LGSAENHHLWFLPSVSTLGKGQEGQRKGCFPSPVMLLHLWENPSAPLPHLYHLDDVPLSGAVSSSPGQHTLCPASGVCLLDGLSALSV